MAYILDEGGLSISDHERQFQLIAKGGGSDGRLGFALSTNSGEIDFSVYNVMSFSETEESIKYVVTTFSDSRTSNSDTPAKDLIEEAIKSFARNSLPATTEILVRFSPLCLFSVGDEL